MTDREDRGGFTYRDAGVDTAAGARAVDGIRALVRSTYRAEVIGDIGGFGGLFSAAALKDMAEPILVSGADGVGTKIEIAKILGRHDTVGIDLVAMCANDVLVCGAEPLFFLDYVAVGRLDPDRMRSIVAGVAEGCLRAGCSLLGGEMAEHPGVMDPGDYDLSGFCVGAVDRPRMVTGERIEPGDVILGLASSGLHSNGFSLVRRVLVEGREEALLLPRVDLGGVSLGETLLTPTRMYVKPVLELLRSGADVRGMAHITGGGITENLDRCLPRHCDARVVPGAWKPPAVFGLVAEAAGLADEEMLKTFNMGVGFAVVLSASCAADAAALLREGGETVWEIGEVVDGSGRVVYG